ncbi:baculoviral IAP repeat-containing protein 7 isoform X1 [Tachyglossus aculeatus]|uniref:baculoviral IAP repeat-containing protein 7 isoform X1 n=1 Tax=Tachyglossus aculeatus TaxID=9261 RepID=UPI0018F63045|nr:baculoviral IAP repeat-containing protein 7 isoform X1 [Tachyglossus aculeatus]
MSFFISQHINLEDNLIWDLLGIQDDGNLDVAKPSMRSEKRRQRTFLQWPSTAPVSGLDLAKAGFFFVGPGDSVKCFCCGGILKSWVPGDSPMSEHQRFFPNCDFVLGKNVGNVPTFPPRQASDCVDGQILSQLQRIPEEAEEEEEERGLARQPTYPDMESEAMRQATFHNWPLNAMAQPEQLAKAGFFYSGHRDKVTCYYCDGGLRNWEQGDDPWREHAKWFPRCEFLLQARGRDYINSIHDLYFTPMESLGSSGQLDEQESTVAQDQMGNQDWPFLQQFSIVQSALQMGFDQSLVESLVQSKYVLTGACYTSVSDLVSDLLQEEENRGPVKSAPETPAVRTESQPECLEGAGNLSTEEQLQRLQEERTCKVCMNRMVSIVFVPCGHLVVCTECAPNLQHCPICRALIRGSVRTFMS